MSYVRNMESCEIQYLKLYENYLSILVFSYMLNIWFILGVPYMFGPFLFSFCQNEKLESTHMCSELQKDSYLWAACPLLIWPHHVTWLSCASAHGRSWAAVVRTETMMVWGTSVLGRNCFFTKNNFLLIIWLSLCVDVILS